MLAYDRQKKAVCDEMGNKVLRQVDWSIDQELFAQVFFDESMWNIIAIQRKVADADGSLRLGWEVVKIGVSDGSAVADPPIATISSALKAFGYGNGDGREDDIPVYFSV